MASQDLFASGRKVGFMSESVIRIVDVQRSQGMGTPSLRASRAMTPSQSPTRSVKPKPKCRLPSHTQPSMDYAQVNGLLSWNMTPRSLPYNLRSLSSHKIDKTNHWLTQLFANNHITPREYSQKKTSIMDDSRIDNRIIELSESAFFYAFFINGRIVNESSSISHARSSDIEFCRLQQEDEAVHRLEQTVMYLASELNVMKSHINQESKCDVITHTEPSRSILEELFTDEPDLATAGNFGTVLATPDTSTYAYPILHSFFHNMLSVSVETPHRPPQTTIQGLIKDVGDCWAFSGERGRLVLALHQPSALVRVSLSHIPSSLSVTGVVDSAPRRFLVLAHLSKDDLDNGLLLGDFEYVREGPWRQVFTLNPMVVKEQLFHVVEFRFLTNNGNPSYTCIYRVHVHGRMYF